MVLKRNAPFGLIRMFVCLFRSMIKEWSKKHGLRKMWEEKLTVKEFRQRNKY